jgi:hypothetical protein
VACIFKDGCRDNSTKESRLEGELKHLSAVRQKNPNVVVLNKRFKAPINKAPPMKATVRPGMPKSYITSKVRELRQSELLNDGSCKHDPARFYAAMDAMWGGYSTVASIKVDTKISAKTVMEASSGYYLADGEMVYVHSDGSVCRLGINNEVKCPCKSTHHR